MKQKKAILALEDGSIFEGLAFGRSGEAYGEVVFNTSLSGYQEILTDPSYKGQIVTMTYPLIGNYGVNSEDVESRKPFVEGFVVKECSRIASNWRSQKGLDEYLKEYNVFGIEGVDTRALTRHIRLQGAMRAVISSEDLDKKNLVKKAKCSPGLIGRDLVKDVAIDKTYVWGEDLQTASLRGGPKGRRSNLNEIASVAFGNLAMTPKTHNLKPKKVVVLDCGVKYNILRHLAYNNCKVLVVPANTSADEILAKKPDGLLLSNGPGDPAGVPYVVKTVKKLLGKIPIFGICLGHQMLGLALGGRTYKLKFGHHGGNHPVKDLKTGKIDITVQNHGFCVDINSLNKGDIEITHMNLNDNTLEGMRHKKIPVFSIQFHPEASPGPHDSTYLFNNFVEMMKHA